MQSGQQTPTRQGEQTRQKMIGRLAMAGVAVAALAACAGETRRSTVGADEAVMIQKGTYVYDPNKRHAPVSLSGADLAGIVVR